MDDAGRPFDLGQIYIEARRQWLGIDLDPSVFANYVRERLGSQEGDPGALHFADLYLACACIQNVPGALETLNRRYLAAVGTAVGPIDSSPAFADEVTQILRERLFVGNKLAGYSGRGSLASWTAVAAYRIGLSLKRRQRSHTDVPENDTLSLLVPEDPELTYLKRRYRKDFQAALTAALAGLSERQQIILRLSLVNGVTHARIAAIYGVNQSTVTRWVTAARQQVWEDLRGQLADRLHMGSGEVDSLIRVMKSDLHFSISGALKNRPP